MSNHELSILFFLELAFILVVIRLVGAVAKKIGQPQAVGEMIAGVLMGPSLFGKLLPDLQAQLFPQPAITIIYAVSQVGLVLYMFIVGVEFNVSLIRQRFRSAALISFAGISSPFVLGGAMDDAAAWCILAIVLASFGGDLKIAVAAIGGGLLYAAVVLLIAKPLLRRLETIAQRHNGLSGSMFGFILMLLMLGAWFTDYVGIYAVFGAFFLGAAMPRGVISRDLQRFLEPLTTNFLVPLYFIYSGLNTRLDLLVTPALLQITVVVVLVACFGKGIACWAAARLSGEDNREALAIGTLMNARGLMELILLNIGLQHGIITPTLFTVMVIMAVVTTLMASPLFELVYRKLPRLEIKISPSH